MQFFRPLINMWILFTQGTFLIKCHWKRSENSDALVLIINVLWVATVCSVCVSCLQNVSAGDVIVRAASTVTLRRGSAHKVRQMLTLPSCSADECVQGNVVLLKVLTRFKFSSKLYPVTLWPRPPPPGNTGWSATWACHQNHVTINGQRRVTILDPAACGLTLNNTELMCVSNMVQRLKNDDDLCQNLGALVVVRNRLVGFVLRLHNSSVDICMQISPYIPWIKETVFVIQ